MDMLIWVGNILIDTIKFVLVLGFLVFIHELGHFLVAKKVGIKVHEFALGFGKKLLSLQKGETMYAIRLIPLGGFIRMEGEEERSDDERSFNKKSIPKRMAVVFAGPLMNIMVALIMFFALNMYGGGYVSNVIDKVESGSNAAVQGLKGGDQIIKINDQTIRIRDEVNWLMREYQGKDVKITVLRNDVNKDFVVAPFIKLNFELNNNYQDKSKNINIKSDKQNIVSTITEGSGLDKLGLKQGDKIVSINETPIESQDQVRSLLGNVKTNKVFLKLERDKIQSDKEFDLAFLKRNLIGFTSQIVTGDFKGLVYNSFWKSIFITKITVVETSKLFVGKYKINQMMGPVGIASEISSAKQMFELLGLAGYISLGLGIANLIPFPPLDGGKILTLTIEAVRRKPINPEKEAAISMVGFSLLIMLMLVVMYNDILRLFT